MAATLIDIPATGAPGNFQVAHGLGRKPFGAKVLMTSDGKIHWQADANGFPKMDSTNLYLVASDTGLTGKALVW